MTGIVDMLSDELKDCKVGDFACEDGTYVVPVNITVNIANLGDVAAVNTVEETIIFRIHFIDIEIIISRITDGCRTLEYNVRQQSEDDFLENLWVKITVFCC